VVPSETVTAVTVGSVHGGGVVYVGDKLLLLLLKEVEVAVIDVVVVATDSEVCVMVNMPWIVMVTVCVMASGVYVETMVLTTVWGLATEVTVCVIVDAAA